MHYDEYETSVLMQNVECGIASEKVSLTIAIYIYRERQTDICNYRNILLQRQRSINIEMSYCLISEI